MRRRSPRVNALRVIGSLLLSLLVANLAAAAGGNVARSGDLADLARKLVGADQGVYVEAGDGTVLVAQAAGKAVHPASVSKIPTTLALLRGLGPEHRFVTTFSTNGTLRNDELAGDLMVATDGDPYLVDENALLITQSLRTLGIASVSGQLRVPESLVFNWISDNAAARLQHAMSGGAPPAAWQAVLSLGTATERDASAAQMPALRFTPPGATTKPTSGEARVLIEHRSQPLLSMVKQLNDYSNNIFKPLADAAGGAVAVQSLARSLLPEPVRNEVTLGDGAGTDARNRLSPRAAVKLLRLLEQELVAHGHTLVDALPVAGVDEGTLLKRFNAAEFAGRVVGKTGTFGDYGASALVGAFNSSDHGTVYFAVLNHNVPVIEARRRQDAFVAALLTRLPGVAWEYERDARPAVARAEVVLPSR